MKKAWKALRIAARTLEVAVAGYVVMYVVLLAGFILPHPERRAKYCQDLSDRFGAFAERARAEAMQAAPAAAPQEPAPAPEVTEPQTPPSANAAKPLYLVKSEAEILWRNATSVVFSFVPRESFSNLSLAHFDVEPAVELTDVTETWSDQVRLSGNFQAGQTYRIRVKAGLTSASNATLRQDTTCTVTIPDYYPNVAFLTAGRYLPLNRMRLPYQALNLTPSQDFKIYRAYENNLTPYDLDSWQFRQRMQPVATVPAPTDAPKNIRMNGQLDLAQAVGQHPGVYMIENDADRSNRHLAIVTDLGVVYSCDERFGFCVAIRRLSNGTPVADASIEVVGQKNQPLFAGTTNEQGLAVLSVSPGALATKDFPARRMLVRAPDGDLTVVDLSSGCQGETPTPRASLWADREAVRPGEPVRAYALVRMADSTHPLAETPLSFLLFRPDGTRLAVVTAKTDPNGLCFADFSLPETGESGTYTLSLSLGDTHLTQTDLYVADVVADRMRLSMTVHPQQVDATAQTYFGTPVAGARGTLYLEYLPAPLPATWKDWAVGLPSGDPLDFNSASVESDAEGAIHHAYAPAETLPQDAPYRLLATLCLSEPSGRTVTTEAYGPTLITQPAYIGLRESNGTCEATLLLADGSPLSEAEATLTLQRIEWVHAFEMQNGTFRRNWTERKVPVSLENNTVKLQAGKVTQLPLSNLQGGHYELRLALGEKGPRTQIDFWHDYGELSLRSANPNLLVITSDQSEYRPGDHATLSLPLMEPGTLFLASGANTLEHFQSLDLTPELFTADSYDITLPIPEDTLTSTYQVRLTFIPRDLDHGTRLQGTATLKVDQSARQGLPFALHAPERARPEAPVSVKVEAPAGSTVVLFAVDEGLLALTNYQTPNPLKDLSRISANFSLDDIYQEIYPNLVITPDGRIGGGAAGILAAMAARAKDALKKPTLARIVLPPERVPESGSLALDFPAPADFQGELRIMAVAVDPAGRVASADHALTVRPPATIQIAAPRFACPGDQTEVALTLTNHDLPESPFTLSLNGTDIATGTLANGATTRIVKRLDLTPQTHELKATLRLGEHLFSQALPLTLRGPTPTSTRASYTLRQGRALQPGEAALSSPTDMTARATDWLAGYPYCCTEQLSAKGLALIGSNDPIERAQMQDIALNLLPRRRTTGEFRLWPAGSEVSAEASLMATYVIAEAMQMGVVPHDSTLMNALQRRLLTQARANAQQERALAAFATWAAAHTGVPDKDLFPCAYNLLATNGHDGAALFAATALVKLGYAKEGSEALHALLAEGLPKEPLLDYMDQTAWQAACLAMLCDAGLANALPDGLLAAVLAARWETTQANAWAAFAFRTMTSLSEDFQLVRTLTESDEVCPNQPIALSRTLLDAEGKPCTTLRHGDLAYVRIDFTLPRACNALAIRDLLPGGLEYEDAALATRASREMPKWATELDCFLPTYQQQLGSEMRFFGPSDAGTYAIVYPVRAVSRGLFRLPATLAEAMYEPELTGGYDPKQTLTIE